jgi:hypothetical protein
MGVGGGIGCGGEMGCSWALYIVRGRLAEATKERSRWQPVLFNGAAVSCLESTPRGRGNGGQHCYKRGSGGGAVRLWTWRQHSARWQLAGRAVVAWHRTGGGR